MDNLIVPNKPLLAWESRISSFSYSINPRLFHSIDEQELSSQLNLYRLVKEQPQHSKFTASSPPSFSLRWLCAASLDMHTTDGQSLVPTASKATHRRKEKKVKHHPCKVCNKLFPRWRDCFTKTMRGGLTNTGRPSALRTHMNSHDNAKRINYALLEPVSCQWHSCLPPPAFACEFPGCTMSFSVQSNARRHLRIHNSSATPSVDQPPSIPYVVEFTQPMITPTLNCPTRLRWKPCRVFSKWM